MVKKRRNTNGKRTTGSCKLKEVLHKNLKSLWKTAYAIAAPRLKLR